MTTMIRKCRVLIAVSILTAVIMSFPIAATSEAMVERGATRHLSLRICPIDWRQSPWHVKQLIRCVAAHYGVSERTIKTFREKGLPGVRVGREVLFDVDACDRWIESHA